jgi:hypothetical protein
MELTVFCNWKKGKVIAVSQFKYEFQDADDVPLDMRLRVYHASPHEPLSSGSDLKEATVGVLEFGMQSSSERSPYALFKGKINCRY